MLSAVLILKDVSHSLASIHSPWNAQVPIEVLRGMFTHCSVIRSGVEIPAATDVCADA